MERNSPGAGGRGQEGRFYTPDASPRRQAIERRSAPLLIALRGAPRWLLPLIPVALLLVGLAVPSAWGALALAALLAVLGWLAYLSWPSLGDGGRLLRGLALLALLALTVLKLLGRI